MCIKTSAFWLNNIGGNMFNYNSIKKTAKGFEESFYEGAFYNMQTQDSKHLSLILQRLNLSDGKKILDLGTGSGYLAFPLASQNQNCEVIGLDIVKNTIQNNNLKASQQKIKNLKFLSYDGLKFPFDDGYFDIIVTRYAIHHFPDIDFCFKELSRILKNGGQLYISDPTPNKEDNVEFIDKYMQIKDDGHIKCYFETELLKIANNSGFEKEFTDFTEIRFPRKYPDKYFELMNKTEKRILDLYKIGIKNNEIIISEDVLNISLKKININ